MSQAAAAPAASPAGSAAAPAPAGAAGAPAAGIPAPYVSASLYVGDLHSDVAESQLFEVFSLAGGVASIRVCRDVATRRSLGYAYVNFHNAVDAQRALDTLNNAEIKGKPCRIMWSQRDPSVRKSGAGNIFIKNLDKAIDHKTLYDTFSTFGNILSCKVALDDSGRSRGYGFVHFETDEMAANAMKKVNGMLLNGSKVFVGPFIPRKERVPPAGANKFTNVFVKNLDDSVTSEQLRSVFADYGRISSCVVMEDKAGKSRCFGFVNFETPEDAQKAADAKNGTTLTEGGKILFAARAQKKADREAELRRKFEQQKLDKIAQYQGVNLYIKNLDDEVDDAKLQEVFLNYGKITSCKIMRDDKGNSKGFGFVCFSNPEEATRAANDMNTKMVFNKPLYVALAQRKDQRRAQLEAQHSANRAKRLPAGGMTPVYPAGASPVFYPPQPQQFVYAQPMVPRNQRWGAPQQPYPMNYMAGMPPMQQRPQGQPGNQTGRHPRGGMARRGGGGPAGARGQPRDQPQQSIAPGDLLLSQKLATLPADQHLNVVGEALYPIVEKIHPEFAGKITGMLLDRYSVNFEELAVIIENEQMIHSKINEAMDVLIDHQKASGKEEGK